MNWLNAIIQGVLVGGLYAMYATGLSVSFGVMRLVNLAHGDLAVGSDRNRGGELRIAPHVDL